MIGPLPFLFGWLSGLLSLALVAGAVWLGWEWREDIDREDWLLWTALALSAFVFLGRWPISLLLARGERRPPQSRRDGEVRDVLGPDGAKLDVQVVGRADAPTLIFTHGWALNGTVWDDAKRDLGDRFRIVTWDLPGLGRSPRPRSGAETLDVFADSLRAVLDAVGGPAVLVGHSIGGMTTQTFARRHAETLGREVKGLVLVNTTYTAPDRTMWGRKLFTALREPLVIPLMRLTVLLAPLVWLQAWMSYLNGTMEIGHRLFGFGRHVTRPRLELSARLAAKGSPAVQARGNIAMLRWDASDVPPRLTLPVLVLGGGRDLLTQADASRHIASAAPGAELTVFDDAGHMGFLERPQDYNQAVETFARTAFSTTSTAERTGS